MLSSKLEAFTTEKGYVSVAFMRVEEQINIMRGKKAWAGLNLKIRVETIQDKTRSGA